MLNYQIVRKVMKKYRSSDYIFTNKYKNCRTVKTYPIENKEKQAKMIRKIEKKLTKAGFEYTIKVKEGSGRWGDHGHIIVRLGL